MRDATSGCACLVCVLLRFDKKLFYPFMFYEPISTFIVTHSLCVVARSVVNTQHSIGCLVVSRRKKRVLGILTISNLQTSEIYRS